MMTSRLRLFAGPGDTQWIWLLALLLVFAGRPTGAYAQSDEPGSEFHFDPPSYVLYRAPDSLEIDGRFDEQAWQDAEWSGPFVDIRGEERPAPDLQTRVKMLWDDRYFYIAAELEEPDVWATFTERDAAIFREDAFEVFIDPNGDTHNYYEFEINALETFWDLLLVRASRDGGPSISAWDIRGIDVGVQVHGTLNDPSDTDEGWTVELAFPWEVLAEAAPEGRRPQAGEQWRINFARPDWPLEVADGTYKKKEGASASWWTWAPQGEVNMHRPEYFGYVQFAEADVGEETVPFVEAPNEQVKWALRQLYYRQNEYHDTHGRYAADLTALNASEIAVDVGDGAGTGGGRDADSVDVEPTLEATQSSYEITAPGANGTTVHIRHDGRVWTTDE